MISLLGNLSCLLFHLVYTYIRLVHISEIKKERIDKVSDHLEVGQTVKVKLIKIDDRTGKLSLSIKSV